MNKSEYEMYVASECIINLRLEPKSNNIKVVNFHVLGRILHLSYQDGRMYKFPKSQNSQQVNKPVRATTIRLFRLYSGQATFVLSQPVKCGWTKIFDGGFTPPPLPSEGGLHK